MNLRVDRHTLATLQFEVIELKYDLGVLSTFTRFYAEYMTYKLRPFGDIGSVRGLGWGFGLNDNAVAILRGL